MIAKVKRITWLALVVLGLLPASSAHAQGCVLCYTSLANGGPTAMHAFLVGMFVLLIPALLLFVGILAFVFYRARLATASA